MPDALCPACGAPLQLVWVHGHGQCANCVTTVVPCCMGAGQEADEHGTRAGEVTVDDVESAFRRCANGSTSVTLDALLLALAEREECPLDVARAAVERAEGVRRVAIAGRTVRLLA